MKNNDATISAIALLRRLLPYALSHKGRLIIGTTSMLVGIVLSFCIGLLIKTLIDGFPEGTAEFNHYINNALIIAVWVIIASSVSAYITSYFLGSVAIRVTTDLRNQIFSNIITRKLEYVDKQSSGDMQTRIVNDAGQVGGFLSNQVPNLIATSLKLLAGVVGAIFISPKLTLFVLASIPFIFLPFIALNKKLRTIGMLVQAAISDVGRYSGEVFRNVKIVRVFNKEQDEIKKFSGYTQTSVSVILRKLRLSQAISNIVGAISMLGFALLLWTAAKDIFIGKMTIGDVTSYAYFTSLIVASAGSFLKIYTSLNIAVGTTKKVLEYLNDEKHVWPSQVEQGNTFGTIGFHNVSFSYPSRPDCQVLRGVDLSIEPGLQVAVVGSSGAGKSTIFELLLKLYPPLQGAISINDIDISQLDSSKIRELIGYVPQKESLITGSVYDNIAYGLPKADEPMVIEAAKKANADGFIRQLPQGYDTDLGEVGARLSGGQKQRISLARALIRDPKILLLDEAKSGLDVTSESMVAKALHQWSKQKNATVISITHSLKTVANADLILVMDKGVIVGQGRHEQLLKSCPLYQQMSFADNEIQQQTYSNRVLEDVRV